MFYLKQSTASQSVLIGPFVDDTDGATAETGLTIANTDIRLSANGGNLAAKTSGGGTHDEAGWYTITLDATDTATVGRLQLHCKVSGALMVHHEYQVLEESIYDALIAASAAGFDGNQRVDVGSWLGTAAATPSVAGVPEVDLTHVAGATTNVSALATNVDAILTDTSTTLQAELDGIQADTEDIQTQIGTAGAGLTDLGGMSTAMKAEVNAEVVDTLNTDPYAEPSKGPPGATISLAAKIGFLYKAWRNKSDQTSTTYQLYNDDASTVDHQATVSDDATTATKGEVADGP